MQNPISYQAIRGLFIPQEVPYTGTTKTKKVVISKPKTYNALTTIMPLEKVGSDIDYSYRETQPIYITVARRNANLNTKDILFGIFKTGYSESERLVFEDVNHNIIRLFDTDDILATRLPE